MKYILPAILFLSLLLSQKSFAQDIIKFKNGDESKVKVQEITPQEIKYKRFDNLNGPLISILKNTVSSIQYENGTIEKITEDEPPVGPNAYVEPQAQNSTEMLIQGQNDAKRSYDGYHGAGTGTLVTAMLLGPIIGLIPAAACSSTAPAQDRLNFPNPQLVQNISYYTGYTQEAKRVKSRKVWSNYAIGAVISIVAVVALTNTHR